MKIIFMKDKEDIEDPSVSKFSYYTSLKIVTGKNIFIISSNDFEWN